MWRSLLALLRDQPVVIQNVVTALAALTAAFGFVIDEEVLTAVGGGITALSVFVGTVFVWNNVTPTSKLPDLP